MPYKIKSYVIGAVLNCALISSCGANSNLLGLTVPEAHRRSFAYRVSQGQAAFDRGDLEEARKHADEAYAMNPRSERAALLYGFVYLTLAGADPFSLARKMATAEGADDATSEQELEPDRSTTDELGKINDAIGLTDEDIQRLGTIDNVDPDLPVLVPVCAEEGRILVEKLQYVARAVNAACPFVAESARIPAEIRHQCVPFEGEVSQQSEAHFLWAFAHLTEALAYNAVLTYKEPGQEKSNLELRMDKVKDFDLTNAANLASFLATIESIEDTVTAVLPLAATCSENYPTTMLVASLYDLLAVDAAFSELAGVPPKITAGLQTALAKINEIQGSGGQLANLKADITKKMSATLSSKLSEVQDVSDDQRDELCASFDSISAGAGGQPNLCVEEESEEASDS